MDFIVSSNEIFVNDEYGNKIISVKIPTYQKGSINITSVVVDSKLRGQGLASKAMDFTYDYLVKHNLKAVLTCPYAIYWFNKNIDKKDVLLDEKLNVEACEI